MYRVLLAVDDGEEIAEAMAEHVASLPDASESVEVAVVHVFNDVEAPPNAAVWEPPRRENPDDEFDSEVSPAGIQRAMNVLDDRDISYDVRTERGTPADDIVRIAVEFDADTIYIGGKDRSPAGKLLFGSVSQSVLFSADRPVAVFESPGR